MHRIAVLLTCHNRKSKTCRCLESLFSNITENEQTLEVDVYLTDDGSTDGTSEAVKTKFPTVHLCKGTGNLFWTRGMNNSWKEAIKDGNYDFYLWLNDDVMLKENAVWQLIVSSKKKNHKAIISGAFKSQDTGQSTYGGFDKKGLIVSPNGTLQQIELLSGNFVLIPQFVYKKIGMLDSFFHHGNGDFDYGLRAKKKGIGVYLTPEYVGYCERHDDELPLCYNGDYSLKKRIQFLYSPSGPNPLVNYKFYLRHYSIYRTIKFLFKTNVLTLFPFLKEKSRSSLSKVAGRTNKENN